MPEGRVPIEYYDLLEEAVIAHLATVGPAGRPEVNPVWVLCEHDELHLSILEGTSKLRNVRDRPDVALSFLDPENPSRYVEVRGRVTVIERYDDLSLVNALSLKYTGSNFRNVRPGQVRFRVRVAVRGWTALG